MRCERFFASASVITIIHSGHCLKTFRDRRFQENAFIISSFVSESFNDVQNSFHSSNSCSAFQSTLKSIAGIRLSENNQQPVSPTDDTNFFRRRLSPSTFTAGSLCKCVSQSHLHIESVFIRKAERIEMIHKLKSMTNSKISEKSLRLQLYSRRPSRAKKSDLSADSRNREARNIIITYIYARCSERESSTFDS